jgi:hypothetical protein
MPAIFKRNKAAVKRLTSPLAAGILFTVLTVSPVMAEIDGSVLLDNCNKAVLSMENRDALSVNSSAVNFCLGYITGVNDLHASFVRSISSFEPPLFCAPPATGIEHLVRTVVKFLKAHPEDLSFPGSALTIDALKEAYPCPYSTTQQ